MAFTSNENKIHFAKRNAIKRLTQLILPLHKILRKQYAPQSEMVLIDQFGNPVESKATEQEAYLRLIEEIKHVKETVINPDEKYFIYPIWMRNPVKYGSDTDWFKEYFIAAIYVNKLPENDKEKISDLLSLISMISQNIVTTSIDNSNTTSVFLETQNELKRLYDFTNSLGTQEKIENIIEELTTQLNILDPMAACVLFLDNDNDQLYPVITYPAENANQIKKINLDHDSLIRQIFEKNTADIINDDIQLHESGIPFKTLLAVPLSVGEHRIGLICVFDKRNGQDFFAGDKGFVSSIAIPASVAILNIQLKNQIKNNAWKVFSKKAAHRIGNALFGLKGDLRWIDTVRKNLCKDDGEIVKAIIEAENTLDNTFNITQDFLNFGDTPELSPEPTDVNKLLSNIVSKASKILSEKNIEISFHPNEPLPEIAIDPNLFRNCIDEMINNSSKHLDAEGNKGNISIKSELSGTDGKTTIGKIPGKQCILITIQDNGQGIPLEHFEKVFEPFFTTRANGAGLGLQIVKSIIESHKGTVKCTDSSNNGACFVIQLPI